MTRIYDRRKVIELRKQGRTYSDIRALLHIPKSTLSDWLSRYPLNDKQLMFLKNNRTEKKKIAIEKYRITRQRQREVRLNSIYNYEKKCWNKLNHRELLLAGIFLYWGEGGKRMNGPITINNTDPNVLKFALYWMLKGLGIAKENIKVDLHLYSDMSENDELLYWSKELGIPIPFFRKPYIKKSSKLAIDQKCFGHGTCGLVVNDIRLKEKIMMSIRAISDYYNNKILYNIQ